MEVVRWSTDIWNQIKSELKVQNKSHQLNTIQQELVEAPVNYKHDQAVKLHYQEKSIVNWCGRKSPYQASDQKLLGKWLMIEQFFI